MSMVEVVTTHEREKNLRQELIAFGGGQQGNNEMGNHNTTSREQPKAKKDSDCKFM